MIFFPHPSNTFTAQEIRALSTCLTSGKAVSVCVKQVVSSCQGDTHHPAVPHLTVLEGRLTCGYLVSTRCRTGHTHGNNVKAIGSEVITKRDFIRSRGDVIDGQCLEGGMGQRLLGIKWGCHNWGIGHTCSSNSRDNYNIFVYVLDIIHKTGL